MDENLYEEWCRGVALLKSGSAHGASLVLERIRDQEPSKRSVREALGRAYFNSGRHELAEIEFAALVELDPTNHYAYYGVARCAMRRGDTNVAAAHLKVAKALHPEVTSYGDALESIAPQGETP